MKNSKVKKVIAVIMAVVTMCASMSVVSVCASQPDNGGVISPQNVAIIVTTNELTLGTAGKLTCYGFTTVQPGYTAEVIVELQQYDGGWTTIKTWSDKAANSAEVDKDYYVTKGYSYRLKLTHRSYNSSGTRLESFTKYSDTVVYSKDS